MSKYLWLIRHGESTGNLERRIQGWTDYPLTELGFQQAELLAQRLAHERYIVELIASPLRRAAETAEVISQTLALPVQFDDRLKEYNFGVLNGLTRAEITTRFPHIPAAWKANEFWEPLPAEEGDPPFEARVHSAMEEIINHMREETAVVIVTHAGVLNACLRAWLGIVEKGWRTFAFDNASVSQIQIDASPRAIARGYPEGRNYRVLLLNDVSHVSHVLRSRPTWFSARRTPDESRVLPPATAS
jgi:broad specificity phosphatase PhoE